MSSIVSKLKHEFLQVIPPTIFFFLTFEVIAITRDLFLEQYGINISTSVAAAIGALIVAKVIVVVDLLPFVNRFPDKPLIYNVIWKAGIYFLFTLIVRYLEYLIPFVFELGDVVLAHGRLLDEIVWSRFWAVQIWLAVLFIFYCALRELGRVLGREKIRHLFFGPSNPNST